MPAPIAARAMAWLGAILFVASLSYFVYAYAVLYGEPGRGTSPLRAAVVNLLLFTAFALHHSVFARRPVREWVTAIVPAGLERSLYVWVASLLFIALCALWQPVPGMAWRATGVVRWLLLGLQAAGVVLVLRSAAILDIFELAGIRQLDPRPGPVEFRTAGPYGWVRHPIYSGWLLLVFCVPTMTMTRLTFAVVSSVYLLIAIPFEERTLRAGGGDYGHYARRVPWKLIPGVY